MTTAVPARAVYAVKVYSYIDTSWKRPRRRFIVETFGRFGGLNSQRTFYEALDADEYADSYGVPVSGSVWE